ncbi:hypothetical protein [Microbacterium capsulatum]|uniref:Uncharacterized protein n=1 Tax=Microbacterium capsulatum TaxID=3041921 RepID=A0ABU0XDR7_9MICO|nr:hypothetical protein [Microbacterium sp. ASV81]MDQ4213264.1 hypothetical protein [Microbacterium sp. ASV81]
MNTWSEITDGTAIGPVVPVIVGGIVLATLYALWSDQDGVMVDPVLHEHADALSGVQALALADALREVGGIQPPA